MCLNCWGLYYIHKVCVPCDVSFKARSCDLSASVDRLFFFTILMFVLMRFGTKDKHSILSKLLQVIEDKKN